MEKSIIRSNNWRALGIHFALSILGVFSFVVIQGLFSWIGNTILIEAASFIVPVVGGSFIYVLCGYICLEVTRESALRSVLWLACMTIVVGVPFALGNLIQEFALMPEQNFLDSAIGVLWTPQVALNALGIGVFLAVNYIFTSFGHYLSLLALAITPFLPPGLLYVGLRLKIWREEKVVAISEGSDA